ncbi:MAG TPA: hypothetical protein DHV36_16015 [Desulfobacteraceae bacterium]|nr:hypothetical protein [Desulfobacteraceae bacterium]|tara:strand:+ start:573 stop:962 length:390 start_codon:yes stop_codon:yes gene_type:complete
MIDQKGKFKKGEKVNKQLYRLQWMVYWAILILIPVLIAFSAVPASGQDGGQKLPSEFRIRIFPIPGSVVESPMHISFHGSSDTVPAPSDISESETTPLTPSAKDSDAVSLEIQADMEDKEGAVLFVLPL